MTQDTREKLAKNLEKARAALAAKRANGTLKKRGRKKKVPQDAPESRRVAVARIAAFRFLAEEADRLERRAAAIREFLAES